MESTANLFVPPASVAECDNEMEQLREQFIVMSAQFNDRDRRDNTAPREYKQWRADLVFRQQAASQRYKYLKAWKGTQRSSMRIAMQRANGIDATNPLNLLRNARKAIAQLLKSNDLAYTPDIQALLDGIDDYVIGQLNSLQLDDSTIDAHQP